MPGVVAAVIGGVATGYAAHKQASGNTKAAEIQTASDDKALAQAKEIYEQQRADQGPYRQSGYGSLNALNFGLGLPDVAIPTDRPPTPATTTQTAAPPQMSALNALAENGISSTPRATSPDGTFYLPGHGGVIKPSAVANSGLTKVQRPNGMVYLIPTDKVEEAKANGGRVV